MITARSDQKPFLEVCRIKFNNINNRVNNRSSYIANNIKNNFSFPHFVQFARDNGLSAGKHCHRPNRYGDYSVDNLVFISPQEHARISGLERRKLSADQIKDVVELAKTTSLRKIATRFGVSHVTIYRYLEREHRQNGGI